MKTSVAICTYNGEKYIKDQLNSIIFQTLRPDEIIVGDDGSTDNTVGIVENILSDSGIKFSIIKNQNNLGVNANFQNVILHCNGDVIFTSDQDDVWVPNKVELIMSCFEQEPENVLVFSNGYVTDANLKIIGDLWNYVKFTKKKQRKFKEHKYYDVLFSGNCITGAAMAFKKSFVMQFSSLPYMTYHDYWIALHAPLYGCIGMVCSPLFYYRQHGNNVIGAKSKDMRDKIDRWIRNLKNALDNSEKKYEASFCFYERNKSLIQEKNLEEETLEWVKFNYWRNSLKRMKKSKAILEIFRQIITGKYRKFYPLGFAGIQDFISYLSS